VGRIPPARGALASWQRLGLGGSARLRALQKGRASSPAEGGVGDSSAAGPQASEYSDGYRVLSGLPRVRLGTLRIAVERHALDVADRRHRLGTCLDRYWLALGRANGFDIERGAQRFIACGPRPMPQASMTTRPRLRTRRRLTLSDTLLSRRSSSCSAGDGRGRLEGRRGGSIDHTRGRHCSNLSFFGGCASYMSLYFSLILVLG
jgi:hypothetical protein